jgi:two-component system, OmpR family, response regulator QseB
MKVLLVEDNSRIARPLADDLRRQHHAVDVAEDGIKGWEYAQSTAYDLILLDLMLPRLDGISLCKRLRETGCRSLILMLTAKDTTTDKIIGLDAGADDYLVKPFELEELAARIRALSRRGMDVQSSVLVYQELQMDTQNHCVTCADNVIKLTPKEHMILECFLRNPSQVFSRSILLEKLWDFDRTSGEETIKTHIANLRRKIKLAGGSENLIQTVYGVGYRLSEDHPR